MQLGLFAQCPKNGTNSVFLYDEFPGRTRRLCYLSVYGLISATAASIGPVRERCPIAGLTAVNLGGGLLQCSNGCRKPGFLPHFGTSTGTVKYCKAKRP